MLSSDILLGLSLVSTGAGAASTPDPVGLQVHNITRFADFKFENLAIRFNGQILTTTTKPNASIYQVDPLDILPPVLIHTIANATSATGIAEGKTDVFYVAAGDVDITSPQITHPDSYSITEIDVRNVDVLPNGQLTRQPGIKRVASLPRASLLNGIAFARPHSDHLLVADSFRGLIWNVNICSGDVGVTLNDTTTKGSTLTGATSTGINGIKVHDGVVYWTSTGRSGLYKVAIDEQGNVRDGHNPSLVAGNLTCDDLSLDSKGNAYVAGPLDVITKVSPKGEKEIIAGIFNSTQSPLVGPSAVRFGRMASDRWSLYITTNGGVTSILPGSTGISRIDLEDSSASC